MILRAMADRKYLVSYHPDFLGLRCDTHFWMAFRWTPLKINMEHNSEGLEDDFPFQSGDFQVPR